MAVNDRILEAERSLQDIAIELKRMRDAALLLETSQKKGDVVIASAIRLVEKVEQFAAICRNISPADTIARFDGLHTDVEQLANLIRASKNVTRGAIVDVESRVVNLQNQVESLPKSSEVGQLAKLAQESKSETLTAIAEVVSKTSALDDQVQVLEAKILRRQTVTIILFAACLIGVLLVLSPVTLPG